MSARDTFHELVRDALNMKIQARSQLGFHQLAL
ncbi:XisH family protein [Dendronalium phyllosphericum]|nr:XisH family protein [Dendronalium phyllosphericum]